MQISSFPYMAETWAQARAFYRPGGVVRDVMTGLCAEQDITLPAAYPLYFSGVALGYIASPIPFSEAFTAVQTGVVDGVIGSGAEGYYASFRDTTKTYIPANTHFEVWYMIISNEIMASLSNEDQAVLAEHAAAFEATHWTVAEADQNRNEQRLVDELGATVAALTDEDLAAVSAKVRVEVWPQVLEDVGVEWDQAILDQVAAAANQNPITWWRLRATTATPLKGILWHRTTLSSAAELLAFRPLGVCSNAGFGLRFWMATTDHSVQAEVISALSGCNPRA